MLRLQFFKLRDNELQRLVPTRPFEMTIAFDQRMKQTIRMMDLQVSSHAFRAKPAFINGKVIARLNADYMIAFNEKIHSALDCTVRAMSGHDTINDSIGAPAVVRCVVKVRAKLLDDLIQMFDSAHESIREP